MKSYEDVLKDLQEYKDREFVKEGITVFDSDPRYRKMIVGDAIKLLMEQKEQIDAQWQANIKLTEALRGMPNIIRCEECKHSGLDVSGKLWCPARCENVADDWFCADGER